MGIKPFKRSGPLVETGHFFETKDPCLVYDGSLWHIYGTGVSRDGMGLRVFHATAPSIDGPWTEKNPPRMNGVNGMHAGAPGVFYDPRDKRLHIAIQEDYTAVGGRVQYLVSENAEDFTLVDTILEPIPHSGEAGLYDPHFSEMRGEKYMVYAGMPAHADPSAPFVPQPDIYLAKSATGEWAGPWNRVGKILDHADIEWHHNRRSHPDYEWGIEGPQLVELPNGKMLLVATSFLEHGNRGTRQRVFFAVADDVHGPYKSLGPVLPVDEGGEWETGENGHATAHVMGDVLYLFYQARPRVEIESPARWRYGVALFSIKDLST